MKFLIIILLVLASCDFNQAPTTPPVIVPEGKTGDLKFEPVIGYATKAQEEKILSASKKVNEVLNSPCFEEFMLQREMVQTNNKSNAQIVSEIKNSNLIIPVKMYYRPMWLTSAVAYRQPPENIINLNKAYFHTSYSDCYWAETMAHEASHVIGFEHDYKKTSRRPFSVPYSLNFAFEKCCKD